MSRSSESISPLSAEALGAATGEGRGEEEAFAPGRGAAAAALGPAGGASGDDFRTTMWTAPFGRLNVTSNRWPE